MEGSQEQHSLPKPPNEPIITHDWQPGTNLWLMLTGHYRAFRKDDVAGFFKEGNLSLPPSKLEWYNYLTGKKIEGTILGQKPEELIHPSWAGVQDTLRIYAGVEEFLGGIKEGIEKGVQSQKIIPLPSGLGFAVEVDLPKWVKSQDSQGGIVLEQQGTRKGVVFFVNHEKLQTPLDALHLADEIAKLHPQTASKLYTHYLAKAVIAKDNGQIWSEVLSSYPEDKIPSYLKEEFEQAKTYVGKISKELEQFINACGQRLNATPLSENNLKDFIDEVKKSSLFFRPQTKKQIEKTIKRILKRAETTYLSKIKRGLKKEIAKVLKGKIHIRYRSLPEEEREKRVKKLVGYLLERSFRENLHLASSLTERLTKDPKNWLFLEVAERGQEVMLDNLRPSKAMLLALYLSQKGKFNNLPEDVRSSLDKWLEKEWLSEEGVVKNRIENLADWVSYAKSKMAVWKDGAWRIDQSSVPPDDIYKLIDFLKEEKGLREDEVYSVRDWLKDMGIPQEMSRLFREFYQAQKQGNKEEADKLAEQIAEKQKYYTKLILLTQNKFYPGGYDGWNKQIKGDLVYLFEASPHLISLLEEPNCAGRMILVSAMLESAGVFKKEDLVTLATYGHSFLGAFDAQGQGFTIDPSGFLSESFLSVPRKPIFEGEVLGRREIIHQYPLKTGLLTEAGINYSIHLPRDKTLEINLFLLESTNWLEDNLWNNLGAFLTDESFNSLDWVLARSQVGVICDRFPHAFFYFLTGNLFDEASEIIKEEAQKNSPLLPFLKLNLLVMRETLADEKKAKRLEERSREKLREKSEIAQMKTNLDNLLNLLSNIPLPFGLPSDPEKWAEHIRRNPQIFGEVKEGLTDENVVREYLLWNPNLFPKPYLDENDKVKWILPSGDTVRS